MELQALEEKEDVTKIAPNMSQVKPLFKVISEHKDVVKIVIQLNSIISTFKGDVQESLDTFTGYSELWTAVSRSSDIVKFGKNIIVAIADINTRNLSY